MGIGQEKVAKNAKRYYATLEKYGCFNDNLVEILGQNFIVAPASTKDDYNNAFEGGLIDHLLRVAKFATNINLSLSDDLKVDGTSLIKVCLLHQIGKANLFKPINSDWHNKRGIHYDFNNDLSSMRTGERSIFLLTSANIGLTEDEYVAILNYDKGDDSQAKNHNSMLGDLLKMGNVLAIKEEKMNNNE